MMTLESVTIKKNRSYEDNPGRYTAEIEYSSPNGTVKTLLDSEISETLLAFVGPAITKFAHQATLEIEANILLAVEETKKLPPIDVSTTQ